MNSPVQDHRKVTGFLFCLLLSLSLAGCENHLTPATTLASIPSSTPSIVITPANALVTQGGSLSLSATVKGVSDPGVTWSIQEGKVGGTISASGQYTAPTNALGGFHVIATSVADASLTAKATISVQVAPATVTNSGYFTAISSMMTPRVGHTATLLKNGKVLIVGGWNGSQAVASAELYDPGTQTFTPTGSMITPRRSHTATLLADGRVLIAGGYGDYTATGGSGPSILSAETYDPATGMFSPAGNLVPAGGPVSFFDPDNLSILLPDGRVLIAADSNAEIFDPRNGSFTLTGPYANSGFRFPDSLTLLANGKVLFTNLDVPATAVELFDPQSGTFTAAGFLPAPDYGYSATLLTDGRVFFLGSDDFPPSNIEIYDPATGSFATAANTNAGYHQLAPATRLNDGTVLIAGGQVAGGSGSTDAVLFLPSSATFQIPGPMTTPRYWHTSTLLSDGTVLITGGISFWRYPFPPSTNTAEIYHPQ